MNKVTFSESGMKMEQVQEQSRVMLRKQIEKSGSGATVEIEITADNLPEEKMQVVKQQFDLLCEFVRGV